MAVKGFDRKNGTRKEKVYNDFQLTKFRHVCKKQISNEKIKTVLDYGGGGSDWDAPGFDPETNQSAKQFFKVQKVHTFEPARGLMEKRNADCVVCIDVLEHIAIEDIDYVLEQICNLSKKYIFLNVGCYSAAALLPNGDNAHITLSLIHI